MEHSMNDMLLQGVAGQKRHMFFLGLGCQASNNGSLGLLCTDVIEGFVIIGCMQNP